MAHRIPRIKIKGQGARKPAQPSQEPNFYQMPFLPEHSNNGNTAMPHPHVGGTSAKMGDVVVEPRSLATYSRINSSVPAVYGHLMEQQQQHKYAPHHPSRVTNPAATTTTTTTNNIVMPCHSLDQFFSQQQLQQQQPPPRLVDNFLNTLSPLVLSALTGKEQADAAALLQHLRRR